MFNQSPAITALIVVLALVWLPIGANIFRWLIRDEMIGVLGRLTQGERQVARWVVTPLLIVIWPVSLLISGLIRLVSFALDDRANRIRRLKSKGLPSHAAAIKFIEDLHVMTQIPVPELIDFVNDVYNTYKEERNWK